MAPGSGRFGNRTLNGFFITTYLSTGRGRRWLRLPLVKYTDTDFAAQGYFVISPDNLFLYFTNSVLLFAVQCTFVGGAAGEI
jgi:hypothetical protein